MIDEEFLLCEPGIDVEKQRVLVETDLWWYFEINGPGHKILSINLIERQFAFIPIIDHGLKLIKIPGQEIPEIPQNPI